MLYLRCGVAQWLGCRILDQRVPISNPARYAFRSVLEQVTFTTCLVLIKTRKWWTDDGLGQTLTRLETTLCLMCVVQGTYSPDLTTWTKLYHTHTHKYMIKPFKYLYLQNHCNALMKLVMYHLGLLLIIVCSNVDLG